MTQWARQKRDCGTWERGYDLACEASKLACFLWDKFGRDWEGLDLPEDVQLSVCQTVCALSGEDAGFAGEADTEVGARHFKRDVKFGLPRRTDNREMCVVPQGDVGQRRRPVGLTGGW